MQLADVPALLALAGVAAYVVLGGADFGAGFWQLTPGKGERPRALRETAYHTMGPVWEANHVWLIFVLVVFWTGYPVAFGSVASTLAVPLFIAAVGIILRGTAYALRTNVETARGQRRIELVFALSSILTPFALGTVVGGIASGRVPVGNARGDLVTSWLNPTSVLVGATSVATAAYLAAVYLAADAVRMRSAELAQAFRLRALAVGLAAGATALAGLLVLRWDADAIWNGLTHGWGIVALVASALGGVSTLVLVWVRRFGPARLTAALAVGAIVAGWALAQRPLLLPPRLTIEEAAASRATLIALLVTVGIGAVVLVPELILLFTLFLRGTLDHFGEARPEVAAVPTATVPATGRLIPLAVALGAAGLGLTVFTDTGWPLAIGILSLLAFVATAFLVVAVPPEARR